MAETRDSEKLNDSSKWKLDSRTLDGMVENKRISDALHRGMLQTHNNTAGSTRAEGEGGTVSGSTTEPMCSAQQAYSIGFLGLKGLLRYGGSCKVLFGVVNGSEAAVKIYNRTSAAKEEMRLELRAYESLGACRLLFPSELLQSIVCKCKRVMI